MSNDATKKWAEEQHKREADRRREAGPNCLHCGALVAKGRVLCDACEQVYGELFFDPMQGVKTSVTK